MKITSDQAHAILAVKGGADVYGFGIAKALREVQRAYPRAHKKFFHIVSAMNAPKDGAKRQPYFGAIATKKGVDLARVILEKAKQK